MLRRFARQWPWLVVGWLAILALYRYGVTRGTLAAVLPRLLLYLEGFAFIALLVSAAMGIGFPVVKQLVSVEGKPEVPVFAVSLGLGGISLLVLLVGVLGGLYPVMAWVILAAGTLAAVVQAKQLKTWARSVCWREVIGDLPRLTLFYNLLLIAALIGITYALTANGLTPPLAWDEAAYHLALPKLYVMEHGIIDVPYILYSNQPFSSEMLYTLAMLLGSEVMASLTSLVHALLLTAAMWLFTKEALGRRAAFLSVALFWTTPAVFLLAGTTLVEVSLATYAFLSIWAFWRWHSGPRDEWGWLTLSALLAGLAAGTKLTGALVAMILFVLLVLTGWYHHRALTVSFRQVLLFCGTAFLLALPWYVKSYAYTGNPVWPFLNELFKGQYWDALGDEYHYTYLRTTNLPADLSSFVAAPWDITVRPYGFGSFPLGLLGLGLAPIALFFCHHRRRAVFYLASIAGLFYIAWFLMTHQTRFLMPVVPAICMLAGYALDRLLNTDNMAYRMILQCLVAGIILLQLPGIAPNLTSQWRSRLPYLVGAESREEILTKLGRGVDAYFWANEKLPADARLLLMPYENRGYFLERSYMWANPVGQRVLKLEEYESSEALWRDLKRLGFTHLLDNPHLIIDRIRYWPQISNLLDQLKATYAVQIYEHNGVAIYELR
jgi:4-amino-4-deoxy-L-arabinose transferase-like glycosyltransferase